MVSPLVITVAAVELNMVSEDIVTHSGYNYTKTVQMLITIQGSAITQLFIITTTNNN